MEIPPKDLRIDTTRIIGGGSIVRITHLPTGTSVTVDDGDTMRSNRDRAMRELEQLLNQQQ